MKAIRSSYSALEKRPDDGLLARVRRWFRSLPFVPYPDPKSTPRLQTNREALALKGKRKLAVRKARERGIAVPGAYKPLGLRAPIEAHGGERLEVDELETCWDESGISSGAGASPVNTDHASGTR